ncbi:MAG: c-type cytochrome [Ottowia sp.]
MIESAPPKSPAKSSSLRWLWWPVAAAAVAMTLFSLTQPSSHSYAGLTRGGNAPEEIEARIARIGHISLIGEAQAATPAPAAAPASTPAAAPAAPAEVPPLYKKSCAMCHASGAGGAPKLGNKDDWAPRIATGMEEILKVAINGRGGMPARGGTKASDEEIKAVVDYMVSQAK